MHYKKFKILFKKDTSSIDSYVKFHFYFDFITQKENNNFNYIISFENKIFSKRNYFFLLIKYIIL